MDVHSYPKLRLPDGFCERDEEEMAVRGWFHAMVELENGQIFGLNIYQPIRLNQEFNDTVLKAGKPCLYEFNIILVPNVTIGNIRKVIHYLYEIGYFKFALAEEKQ